MEVHTLDYIGRMAVMTALVKNYQGAECIKRTVLMKMLYLLQVVKQVPLGYRFQFYLYGPYDSRVLNDLALAESWGLIRQEYIEYSTGYFYKICEELGTDPFLKEFKDVWHPYQEAIRWVLENFRQYDASQMELLATLVWVDRSAVATNAELTEEQIVQTALALKPKATEETVRPLLLHLKRLNILRSLNKRLSRSVS